LTISKLKYIWSKGCVLLWWWRMVQ